MIVTAKRNNLRTRHHYTCAANNGHQQPMKVAVETGIWLLPPFNQLCIRKVGNPQRATALIRARKRAGDLLRVVGLFDALGSWIGNATSTFQCVARSARVQQVIVIELTGRSMLNRLKVLDVESADQVGPLLSF
jgi:hypothetical protein